MVKGGKEDVLIPKRWYSQQMKIAEMIYPAINKNKKISCNLGCLNVSKILNNINPAVPTAAKHMDNILSTFSVTVRFAASLPLCRSQRSLIKERSRKMVVTTEPAMKRGLRSCAPTSLM